MPIRAAGQVLLPVTGSVSGLVTVVPSTVSSVGSSPRLGAVVAGAIVVAGTVVGVVVGASWVVGGVVGASWRRRRGRRRAASWSASSSASWSASSWASWSASSWASWSASSCVVVVVVVRRGRRRRGRRGRRRRGRALAGPAVVGSDQPVPAVGILSIRASQAGAVVRTVRSDDEKRPANHRVDLVVARVVLAWHDECERVADTAFAIAGRAIGSSAVCEVAEKSLVNRGIEHRRAGALQCERDADRLAVATLWQRIRSHVIVIVSPGYRRPIVPSLRVRRVRDRSMRRRPAAAVPRTTLYRAPARNASPWLQPAGIGA